MPRWLSASVRPSGGATWSTGFDGRVVVPTSTAVLHVLEGDNAGSFSRAVARWDDSAFVKQNHAKVWCAGRLQIGASPREVESVKKLYAKPFVNAGFAFLEPFPVGPLMTLISAAILRRK